jgi:hypothetical protein
MTGKSFLSNHFNALWRNLCFPFKIIYLTDNKLTVLCIHDTSSITTHKVFRHG